MDYGYNCNQQQGFATADTSKTVINDKTAECEIDLIKDAHEDLTEMLAPKSGTTSLFDEMKTSEPRWGKTKKSSSLSRVVNMMNPGSHSLIKLYLGADPLSAIDARFQDAAATLNSGLTK
ncbi:hypothetical protein DFQ28_000792 [Apophysomyces sp. BC1034]|nr:hypothetical protein DFQ28_000792 [Apophysomyces sp. BC1034]